MKKITLSAFVAVGLVFGSACENKRSTEEHTTTTVTETDTTAMADENVGMEHTTDSTEIITGKPGIPVYTTDADFAAMAGSSGLKEQALGKLAAKNAASTDVKKFGLQMASDHGLVAAELKTLAGKKKWTLPDKMNALDQEAYDRLARLSGKDFDRDYMAEMVKDHEIAVGMFEQATKTAADTDLKSFTSKTTPALRTHLDMARTLHMKVSDTK